jgi:hypothetical protein
MTERKRTRTSLATELRDLLKNEREENARLRARLLELTRPAPVAGPVTPLVAGDDLGVAVLRAVVERAGNLHSPLAATLIRYAGQRRSEEVPDDVIAREILQGDRRSGEDDAG